MGIFKNAKKIVSGNESVKDAFTDCEKFYDEIDGYSFMPFDMIVDTTEAIDTLLGQRDVRHHSVAVDAAHRSHCSCHPM